MDDENDQAYQRYLEIRRQRRWDIFSFIVLILAGLSGIVQLVGILRRLV